jgi:hypothetical protein
MRSTVEDGKLKTRFCLLELLMIEREGASAAEMWLSLTTPRMGGNAQIALTKAKAHDIASACNARMRKDDPIAMMSTT